MRSILSATFVALSVLSLPGQQVVLPDNHHLCENPTQLANSGSLNWWRNGAGRFQIVYEASNFTGKSGVLAPVFVTNLRFRGEDGEPNLGGQVYAGVMVQIGSTSLTNSTMSTTFATNVASATTTMGTVGVVDVTVAPSIGSTPNNWCIDIDLLALGAGVVFDPTSAQPNLLIDITVPNAPSNAAPLSLVPIQDTTGTATVIRGRGIYATTATATLGTSSTTPPVVGLEIAGGGGTPTAPAARNERYGAACGGAASTFYEGFLNGQAFDLPAIGGLTMLPDNALAPNFYVVTPGAAPVDLTQLNGTPNSIADDVLAAHTLGFSFAYPGGSTAAISVSPNGYLWLSTLTTSDYTPSIAEMLGSTGTGTARLMLYWQDLHAGRNTGTNPNSGLHIRTDTAGGPGNAVCYVTWYEIGLFRTVSGTGIGGHAVLTFQCVLHQATGIVEFRYGGMPPFVSHWSTTTDLVPMMVGFTRGRIGTVASVDPQSRDLSLESPFVTAIEGLRGHMGQTATATPDAGGQYYMGRCFGGQNLTWGATNVPPGAVIGAQLLDIAAIRPGLQLPGITAPDCMISVSANPVVWELILQPASTVTGTVVGMVPHGLEGTDMYAQFVVLDGLVGAGPLVTVASNAIKHTFGFD